ncbi:MAG: SsrA-binding protein SmpB [Cyanobacteriota bacterium]
MSKDQKDKKSYSNVIATNKKAFHEFHILERFNAGIVLTGTEVKSVRAHRVSLKESYAKVDKGEVWLLKSNIAHYEQGNRYNHEVDRPRKLLLTKQEIRKLIGKTKECSLTLVPLKMYFEGGWAKVELGLAKGKQLYDKRQAIAEKSSKRDVERAMKGNY